MPRRLLALFLVLPSVATAQDTAAQRGQKALEGRAFVAATWSLKSYDQLWKQWTPPRKEAPADYDQTLRDYYGLHPAPYDNGRYPMGLREGATILGSKGIAVDCMLCHASSILGKSYVGLGNASLDIQAVWEDFGKASVGVGKTPFPFGHVRGTSEAGSFAVFLLSFRNPDLSLRVLRADLGKTEVLCEDVPAWWLLKKKKTMYHTGTAHARSVRSIMQFMLTPENGLKTFETEEATFRDIQAHLLTLEAPKYPFPVDRDLAHRGEKLFAKNCASCHGTYGDKPSYPNKIVELDIVGTDPARFTGFSRELGEHYNKSWFGKEHPAAEPKGYQAPPLDGVWATAPYLHNGSVPTLHDVLNSKGRPKLFTRSYKTDEASFDKMKNGWKVELLDAVPKDLHPYERRKIYDTTQVGRGNQGHTFGDEFTDEERRAVIEYLKTL